MKLFQEMAKLDRLVHEPARLAIMSALESCLFLEFLILQDLTGLTKGNLSSHLSKLENAGYVHIEKRFIRRKIPHTTITITKEGKAALKNYWQQLDKIRQMTKEWQQEISSSQSHT